MDEKSILNDGFGSPGETARAMTKEFLKLKENRTFDFMKICNEILSSRGLIYEKMGFNVLDGNMIKRIYIESFDLFPFLILADIYLSNKLKGIKNIQAFLKLLDDVIDVVLFNYNSLVLPPDRINRTVDLKEKIKKFIDTDFHLIGNKETSIGGLLKCNSIYINESIDSTQLLKFYEDKGVIAVCIGEVGFITKMNYDILNENFNKTNCGSKGFYKLVGDTIEFSTRSDDGVAFYSGTVLMNQLDLYLFSNMNGYESRDLYKLVVF
jgi:hypothetical protein